MPLKLIKRKGHKNWIIRGSVAGRRIEKSAGTPQRAEAEKQRIRLEAQLLDRGADPRLTATFAEAVNIYLDEGRSDRFLGPLLDHFGLMRLADIDQTAMDHARATLYPTAQNPTVIRQLITPMSAVMNAAAERGLCDRPQFRRPPVKRAKRNAVKQDWLTAVTAECSPHLAALLIFMAFTGCRVSEAVGLDWENVDLKRGEALLWHAKLDEPTRLVLSRPIIIALANLPRRQGPVFQYASRSSVYGALKTACKAAGVDYRTPHEIGRHSFATWLLEAGHNLHFVKDAGRWKSIRLVSELYGHLERSHVDDGVRELGENWGIDQEVSPKTQQK